MKIVTVESPFAAPKDVTDFDEQIRLRTRNVAYARAAMADCLARGEAPYASHLLYTQPGVLRDSIPEERKKGIEAGLVFKRLADATVVYINFGISSGMQLGIDAAKERGQAVEYRTLPGWAP